MELHADLPHAEIMKELGKLWHGSKEKEASLHGKRLAMEAKAKKSSKK